MRAIDRALLGVAASCAIIIAAWLSGLPSATCAAIAETYNEAINEFGVVALVSVLSLYLVKIRYFNSIRNALLGIMYIGFVTSALGPGGNLKRSVIYCLSGTEAEISEKIHKRIPLFAPFNPPGFLVPP